MRLTSVGAPRTHLLNRSMIYVGLWAFLPIVLISLLGRHYVDLLSGLFPTHDIIPIDLTNFSAIRKILSFLVHPTSNEDSWLPMRHALAVMRGPDNGQLYEALFMKEHVRFQYPPSSLLPLEFLSALGLSSVGALNRINTLVFVLNAGAISALGWLLFRRGTGVGRDAPPAPAVAAMAFAASFAFYPLMRAYILGQIQLWIDLLFTLALLAWLLGRRFVAGLLIGVACTIKPQIGILLLWAVLWRQWKFAGGILGICVPILLVSLYHYGIHNNLAYLNVLSFLSRHGESFYANNSVNGILNWYLSTNDSLRWYATSLTPFNPVVYAGTMVASIISLILICAVPLLHRDDIPCLSDLAAAAICTVVGSPVVWEHHYGILMPLFLVALRMIFTRDKAAKIDPICIALPVSWITVANFIPFASLLAHGTFAIAQAYCFMGALILLGIFLSAGGRTRCKEMEVEL